VQRSLDKRVLLDEARRVGLDPPPSLVCTDRRSATEAARKLGFPVVLKPVRTVLSGTNGLRQQSVVPAGDENALAEALPSFDGHPLLLQRFLPKTGRFSAAGVMTGSGLLAIAVARFNRTWPPRAGAVAFGETVDPPPGLTPRIEQLLERIGWSGIFELEYLEQPDGRAAAIDLNPRLFGWLTLAVTAGANLPAIWCDRLLGNVSATATAHAGVRYRWEEAEVAHFVWQLQHGKLRAAASVARPHRRVVHAHFRLRDPVPLVAQTLHLAAARASR
jgi:predicted ATP-grasp superfamily ATP-dependent carboligase